MMSIARRPAGSLRILVIDDDVETAQAMSMALRLQGHLVSAAFDGDSGVEEAWRLAPYVVFCDIRMPGDMDGYAVARALRGDRRTSRVRLVAISGRLTPGEERRARQAGFDEYLCKPLSAHELAGSLERAGASAAPSQRPAAPRRKARETY
jgi:CheY-like chemotaxis protein